MFELVYCSIAKPDITQSDIEAILEVSRIFNTENNITGCLLYHNHEFVQILEGNEQLVRDLYSRIEQDSRHTNLTLLSTGKKTERGFNNWSMAFLEFSADDMKKADFINNFISFSNLTNKPTKAIRLFWSMSRELLT